MASGIVVTAKIRGYSEFVTVVSEGTSASIFRVNAWRKLWHDVLMQYFPVPRYIQISNTTPWP
jgi:hypothetical protein